MIPCDDGPRQRIDIRDFVTQYSAYSVEFESRIGDKVELSGKLDPVQLQALTEATQQSNEFRKFLIAGYNGCAISQQQYGELGPEHPDVARDATNIGTILKAQGDLAGALEWTKRALAILGTAYGPNNPSTRIVARNLGAIKEAMK